MSLSRLERDLPPDLTLLEDFFDLFDLADLAEGLLLVL